MNSYAQPWVQKATMPGGTGLDAPIYFSIGNYLYVGGGWTGYSSLNTFYQYNPATNTWSQKANIPAPIYSVCDFTLNGKGYVVCGAVPLTNTVYAYDTTTNSWQTKNPFPGSPRQNIIGFSCGGKGYLFGGFTGGSNVGTDLWQYNDTTDTWTQMASCPGPGRDGPGALVINNKIYVGLGNDVNGVNAFSDFYYYDPLNNTYAQVASTPVGMGGPANFTIGNRGYVGIGFSTGGNNSGFYIYDPVANTWTQTNNFGRPGSFNVFCATVGNLPYVGCGIDPAGSYVIDTWTWADSCTLAINLGNDTTLCSGATITLTDTNSSTQHLWNNGATTSSITVSSAGSYWVSDTRGNCTASDTINVTFTAAPAAFSLGNDTTYCGSFTRTLSTGNANTVWNTGTTAASISVSTPGLYWAQITTPCDTVRDSIVISQNPLPVVNLGNDTNICNSNPLTLNATTANATYSWQNGTTAPILTISASGIYWVDVTVNGCMKRDSIVVSYINPNSFSIGDDTTYCGSFSRVLTAGVAHSIWSTGDTATSITVDTPGKYWAVAYACGDTLMDSIRISEKPLPIVDLGNDTSVCPDHDVILNAGNPGATYQWQNNSTGQTLTIDSSGVYWVNVTVNGCTGNDSILIASLSPPSPFTIGNDTTICEDSSIVLNAYQINTNYFWSTGDTAPSITVNQSGQYQVVDSNVCGSYSATASVTTKQCVCKIAIPTAFTPNNDGKNDFFYVLTQCPLLNFQFDIYNRWGQKIFTTDTVTGKWDGTYRGAQQPLGVYVYFLKYTDPYTNKENSQTGNVTLLR